MYIFDSLIFHPGRNPQRMTYSSDNWQLMLTGHADAFSTRSGRPQYVSEVELLLGESWRAALSRLDDAYLQEHLGDVLDRRRLKALGKRRDQLLENGAVDSTDGRDALDFDPGADRQTARAERAARGQRIEEGDINLVHGRPLVDVGEEDRTFHDPVH